MALVQTKQSYYQGELDRLCGIYSLINIIQLLCPKSKSKSRKLFNKILRHLEKTKQQNLSRTIASGLTFKDMKKLFSIFLTAENLYWTFPFMNTEEPHIDLYWNVLMNLLKDNKESCVFIRLRGTHNHWTIVSAITENALILFDSDGLQRIYRKSCNIQSVGPGKPHSLWPKNTVFIYKSQ